MCLPGTCIATRDCPSLLISGTNFCFFANAACLCERVLIEAEEESGGRPGGGFDEETEWEWGLEVSVIPELHGPLREGGAVGVVLAKNPGGAAV